MKAVYIGRFIWLLILGITLCYALRVANNIPLADEWRWVTELLIPYSKGDISLYKYITGEYEFLSHSHFLTLLMLLFSYCFFNLDFSIFNIVGIFFWVLTFILLMVTLEVTLKKNKADTETYICAIAIAAVGFGTITSDFPWLLVTFEYVYFFQAIMLIIMFELYVIKKINNYCFYSFLIWCCWFSETIGFTAVLAVTFGSFIYCVVNRYNLSIFFKIFSIVSVALFFQYFLLGSGIGEGGQSKLSTIKLLLESPLDSLRMITSSLIQPLIDVSILKYFIGDKVRVFQLLSGLSILFIIMYLVIKIVTNENDIIKINSIPIILFVYSFGSCLLIMISRYNDFGSGVLDAQRFTRLFSLYYVSVGFLFVYIQGHKFIKAGVAWVLIICFSLSAYYQHINAHYVINYFDNIKSILKDKEYNVEIESVVGRCDNGYCEDAIKFMKENHLSIYY